MSRLRFSFLPSDFHPMVLVLGEADGVRRFAELLQSFADGPREIDFAGVDFLFTADDTRVVLTAAGEQPGMRLVPGSGGSLVWTLEPWQAEAFAEEVAELAEPDCRSGSAFLEAAVGEIRVKVSLGEFTDDFLTTPQGG